MVVVEGLLIVPSAWILTSAAKLMLEAMMIVIARMADAIVLFNLILVDCAGRGVMLRERMSSRGGELFSLFTLQTATHQNG